jgi:hypothetical protein
MIYLILGSGLYFIVRIIVRIEDIKGCPQDNTACEGFSGRIKNEMFYNRSWNRVSIKEFERLD